MAQTTTTTTTDEPIYIPTIDELDRLAGIDPQTRIDAQTRLKMRIAAHQELVRLNDAALRQGVRS